MKWQQTDGRMDILITVGCRHFDDTTQIICEWVSEGGREGVREWGSEWVSEWVYFQQQKNNVCTIISLDLSTNRNLKK